MGSQRVGHSWATLSFPGGSDGKESSCNVEDLAQIPRLGRSPGGGHGNPLQYSGLENPLDRGAWQATVHGVAESDTSEQLTHHMCSWLLGMYLRWDTTVAITKTMLVTLGTGSAFRKGSAAPQTLTAPSAHLVESRQRSHEQAAFCGSTLNTHRDNTGLSGWAALCAQLASLSADSGGPPWAKMRWRRVVRKGTLAAGRGLERLSLQAHRARPSAAHLRACTRRPPYRTCLQPDPHCWSWGPRDREPERN